MLIDNLRLEKALLGKVSRVSDSKIAHNCRKKKNPDNASHYKIILCAYIARISMRMISYLINDSILQTRWQ